MMPPLHLEPYWRNQAFKPFWANGNGAGTEKMDAYGHLAFWSTDTDDFENRARQPWIGSGNENDKAPAENSHPMGASLV